VCELPPRHAGFHRDGGMSWSDRGVVAFSATPKDGTEGGTT
jgi:hypothetical protein